MRSLIGQYYDHAANMNGESAKELLKLRNSALVCRHVARGKVCNFAFLTSSGGKFYEFFVTSALVIHPLTVKNRPCALIRSCALNRKNTVNIKWLFYIPIA